MAIVHVNGFGTIPVSGDYASPANAFSGTSTFSRQPGRGPGGYSLRHTNSTSNAGSNYVGRLSLPSGLTNSEFSLGVAVNHLAAWTPAVTSVGLRVEASTYTEVQLGTGSSNVYLAASSTSPWNVLVSTPTGVGWHWWNFVFKYSGTGGFFRVYRDGTPLAEQQPDTLPLGGPYTGLQLFLGNANGGAQADFADLIIRNDATIIPDSRVDTLFPDSTYITGWSGSDGNSVNNHLLVNENPNHNPATYVSAATAGTYDIYTFSNLQAAAGSADVMQVSARATKSDAGAKTMRVRANNNFGTAVDPGGGGTVYGLFTTDSGSSWTPTAVNNVTGGIEVIS